MANYTDKAFFRERPMLIQAITSPAVWMNKRGVGMPASRYRSILRTVVDMIKRHGNQVTAREIK